MILDGEEWLTPIQILRKRYQEAKTKTERFHWSFQICSYEVYYEWPKWKRELVGHFGGDPNRKPSIESLLKPLDPEYIEKMERTREYLKDSIY